LSLAVNERQQADGRMNKSDATALTPPDIGSQREMDAQVARVMIF
jgi:hypothetical protein